MDKNKYWIVMSDAIGEGVLFDNETDAKYAKTGQGVGGGFGVSTLAEEFRNLYGDRKDLYIVQFSKESE